jgi:hypothetical protein
MPEGYKNRIGGSVASFRDLPVYCSATEDGGWIVYNFKTDVEGRADGDAKANVSEPVKVTYWDASNATKVLWLKDNETKKWSLAVYGQTTGDAGAVDPTTVYNLRTPTFGTQIWWITEYGDFRRIEAAAGETDQTTAPSPGTVWADNGRAFLTFAKANDKTDQKLAYDPLKQLTAVEGKYTYQSFYVVEFADPKGKIEARIIVLVNTSADPLDISGPLEFPYAPIPID